MRPQTRARFIDWLLEPYRCLYHPERSKKYWLNKGREIERKLHKPTVLAYPICPTCSDASKEVYVPLFREIVGGREVYACPFTDRHKVNSRMYPDTIHPDIERVTDPRMAISNVNALPPGEWSRLFFARHPELYATQEMEVPQSLVDAYLQRRKETQG